MILIALLLASALPEPQTGSVDPQELSDPQESSDPGEIVVIGGREPARIPIDRLRDAQKAYAKYRERYGPDAVLWFEVRAKRDDGSSAAIDLTLEGHGKAVPVSIGADGRFSLPMFADDDWEITSNRPEKAFSIRARVLSPGSREGDWRLGDLQLQCRVSWQLARHESNFAIGALFDAIGGCTSSSIAIYEKLDRPIEAANITEGDKSAELSYSKFGLRLPTYLKGNSNEARVTVSFAP